MVRHPRRAPRNRSIAKTFCQGQAAIHPGDRAPVDSAGRRLDVRTKWYSGPARCWDTIPRYLTVYCIGVVVSRGLAAVWVYSPYGLGRIGGGRC
jgi:hypothetical protein